MLIRLIFNFHVSLFFPFSFLFIQLLLKISEMVSEKQHKVGPYLRVLYEMCQKIILTVRQIPGTANNFLNASLPLYYMNESPF